MAAGLSAAAAAARRLAAVIAFVACLAACAGTGPARDWQDRLSGAAIVMLGEVHDNPEQHSLRLQRLRRAFEAGWRPAIAMEQFDREHQPDIERARRERPGDAQYLIEQAAPAAAGGAGWDWNHYRPFVALALEYRVPLIATNLSREDAGRVFRDGYAAVFDADERQRLGLGEPLARDWERAQQHEIEVGHCHQLPGSMLPAMARAQFARDATMAAAITANAQHGLVFLAGNGHVRRDLGVPRWLAPELRARVYSVGYLEQGNAAERHAYDAVVFTAAASRTDPCAAFGKKPATATGTPR